MRWRRTLTLSALLAAGVPAVAQADTELSVGDRLKDRREVAAGTRAYSVGFQDGRFYANGWHITGEMGGIWTPPMKLVDGVWFGVDDAWVGPATRFTSGWGYTRYRPARHGRPEAAAHGLRARRRARRALRARADQPGRRAEDGHGQGRRPLGADERLPVGRGRRPNAGEQPRRQRRATTAARWRSATAAARRGRTTRRRRGLRPPAPTAARPAPATGARRATRSAPADAHGAAQRATTARSARAPAASCATEVALRPGHRDACGSRSPARTRAWRRRGELAAALRRPGPPAGAEGRRRASGSARHASSTCRATGRCRRRSTGASRTSPT